MDNTKKVYIFADGPNMLGGFRIDVDKLKNHISTKEGYVEKFFWYEIEPSIEVIDFEMCQTHHLNSIEKELTQPGIDLIGKIKACDDKTQKGAITELVYFYESMRKVKSRYESKCGFLRTIGNIVDVVTDTGKVFRHARGCHNCGAEVLFLGKTEAGITDFNLAIDMINFAGRNAYDTAVLVSGDRHYIRPVSYVKDMKKKVVVCSFEDSISRELKSVADEFLSLDSIRTKIEITR